MIYRYVDGELLNMNVERMNSNGGYSVHSSRYAGQLKICCLVTQCAAEAPGLKVTTTLKCIHIYRLHEWPLHPNTDDLDKYFRYSTCFEHFWIIVGDENKKVKFSVPTSRGHVGGGGLRSCTHS